MNALVGTAHGVYTVDLEGGEIVGLDGSASLEPPPVPALGLPRVVAAASVGATVVAVVDARPPLVVSRDAGVTWLESGRGLPRGATVAVSEQNPDRILYAARNRLYLSTDGGRFWQAVGVELPEIETLAFES